MGQEGASMVILGSLVNGIATVFGGVLGLLFKRRMPNDLGDFLMKGLGLCVILVAVQGMVKGGDVVVTVLSIVVGGMLGFAVDIDGWIHRFGDWVQVKIDRAFRGSTALGNFSDGFVSSSLFICIGSMAVLGSLQSGLQLDHSTLFAKAVIDMVVVMVMATTLGVGVPFSGIAVFAYEAALSLGASLIAPLLTDAVINEMVCAGSLLLLAIGLNMLKLTDIKVANYLPAAFMPIAVCAAMQYIQGVLV